MREEAYAALRRYEAMAGLLEGIPEAVKRQGKKDRERYGDRYLWHGADGGFVWNDLMTIRFLVEVCGIPLGESREAAIENCRTKGMGAAMAPAQKTAKHLFSEFGNILEAQAMAVFWKDVFAEQESATQYWRDVLYHIETARFVAEDTGLANWD